MGLWTYSYHYDDKLIPRGHSLVARVEVIDDISRPTPDQEQDINTAIAMAYDYYDLDAFQAYAHRSLQWRDTGPHQFANGVGRIANTAGLWLIDIEPCMDNKPTIETVKVWSAVAQAKRGGVSVLSKQYTNNS